jgi:hypothetical protein
MQVLKWPAETTIGLDWEYTAFASDIRRFFSSALKFASFAQPPNLRTGFRFSEVSQLSARRLVALRAEEAPGFPSTRSKFGPRRAATCNAIRLVPLREHHTSRIRRRGVRCPLPQEECDRPPFVDLMYHHGRSHWYLFLYRISARNVPEVGFETLLHGLWYPHMGE